MDKDSLDIKQKNTEALRELFPNIFSEGKIDLEKFKAAFCEDIYFNNERYTLNWAGKADAFRILQERTSATLKPQPELSVNFDNTENVFIEGENLEVLKVLQKSYYSKIKCIIIDPPYNTGNDNFIYPDRFKENLEDYEKRVGERDEEGYLMKEGLFRKNSKENGHYHSNWLNMMLPRLFLARNLLRDDGVIFVHIDDNEVHNLRLLMNEIFGEENFVAEFVWKSKLGKVGTTSTVSVTHEYILCYSKYCENLKFEMIRNETDGRRENLRQWGQADRREDRPSMYYPITIDGINVYPIKEDGTQGRWRVGKEMAQELLKNGMLELTQKGNRYEIYRNFEAGTSITPYETILLGEVGTTAKGAKSLKELDLGKIFDYSKSVELLKFFMNLCTSKNDIILDFFAGSGTTAHAVLELNKEDNGNRKFILVQLPELCEESSEAYKAGYKTIADISRERIKRAIQKIGSGAGFKALKLSPSNFKVWRGEEITEENIEQQMEMFIDPVKQESQTENMLLELMLKSGYQLTDKVENKGDFFYINNELVIALTKMNLEIATEIIGLKPQKVIALDRLFAGNDELKTNIALQMKDAGVEFRTI